MLRYIKGTLAYGLKFLENGHEDDLLQVSQMLNGQGGGQIIDVLLLDKLSKWLIPQSVGGARKETTVVKSTTEAELICSQVSQATQEAIYL